jgi:hypothetical protein
MNMGGGSGASRRLSVDENTTARIAKWTAAEALIASMIARDLDALLRRAKLASRP